MSESWERATEHLRRIAPEHEPTVGLVLGSGLGAVVEGIEDAVTVSYGHLPGFPAPTVQGHSGRLVLGRLSGVAIVAMQGRTHFYETGRGDGMSEPLKTLQALGCERLILTNAAGSLKPTAGPGSLMLIRDHINLGGLGPLIGTDDSRRFVDMVDAYDPKLRKQFMASAVDCGIDLHAGVYMWFAGPSFETPAEIAAARTLGADAVGMSTVPEVIIARMLGMRVVAVSAITNLAAGMTDSGLSHAQTVREANRAGADLGRLIARYLEMENDER